MELTAVRTGSGVFRVHRAGCDDIAKDAAQARGPARDIDADSREAVIRLLWTDVARGLQRPGRLPGLRGENRLHRLYLGPARHDPDLKTGAGGQITPPVGLPRGSATPGPLERPTDLATEGMRYFVASRQQARAGQARLAKAPAGQAAPAATPDS